MPFWPHWEEGAALGYALFGACFQAFILVEANTLHTSWVERCCPQCLALTSIAHLQRLIKPNAAFFLHRTFDIRKRWNNKSSSAYELMKGGKSFSLSKRKKTNWYSRALEERTEILEAVYGVSTEWGCGGGRSLNGAVYAAVKMESPRSTQQASGTTSIKHFYDSN